MGWRFGDTEVEADGDDDVDHGEQDHHGRQYQLLCKQEELHSDQGSIYSFPRDFIEILLWTNFSVKNIKKEEEEERFFVKDKFY